MSIAHLYSVDQRLDAVEAAHADAGVHLHLRAHARGAVLDAFFQRRRRARVHVLDRHGLLDRRDAEHRAELGALLRRAAVDDARLVEMDVALDQAGTGQQALGVVDRRVGGDIAPDGGDAAVCNADVERLAGAVIKPRVADDEVHGDVHWGRSLGATAPS